MRRIMTHGRIRRGFLLSAVAGMLVFLPQYAAFAEEEGEIEITSVDEPGSEEVVVEPIEPEIPEEGFVDRNGYTYFLDEMGMEKTGFFEYEGALYYADAQGRVRTKAGWLQVDAKWYYVAKGGVIRRNEAIWTGGTVYYAGNDGALTGGAHQVGNALRFFDQDGKIVKQEGWIKYDDSWYYLKANGFVTADSVIDDGGKLYYIGPDGRLTEAIVEFEGKLCYFDKNGKLKTSGGWVSFNGDWYFVNVGGEIATDRILGTAGKLYYVGTDGKCTGGIHELDGAIYYFDESGALSTKKGWISADGKWYYGNGDGKLRTNSGVWSGGSLYYLGENGVLTGGIQKVGDKLRYFDKNGKLKKGIGWLKQNKKWYYIDKNGIVYSDGKYKIDGAYYYFDKDGVMKTGVIQVSDGKMYYAKSNGQLITSRNFTIDDIRYYADETGDIAVGTMYKKAQSYSSDTGYLILVNLSTQKTAVFKGSTNNWMLMREFTCSSGTSEHPTPTGEYKTTIHDLYFDSYGWRCWYATGFIGGLYLFHSSPYYQADEPKSVADRTMGKPSSHGCIRLTLEDAKWMYDTLPLRTKVVIFK